MRVEYRLDIVEKNIQITRGNYMPLTVVAKDVISGNNYMFQVGDIVRFKILEKKNMKNVLLEKDFEVKEEMTQFLIELMANEMKIGELIDKPVDYWYEIELNPDTDKTQTIVGYEKETGPAVLTLLPEGGDIKGTTE